MSSTPGSPAPEQPGAPTGSRKVVFVVGSGRSGTSTMSGTLQTLGMYVPQPEVKADDTNPKGFGEPQWVVDFHDRLLRRANVQTSDARPQAWLEAGKLATDEAVREELYAWLQGQFEAGGDELVVKDPRLAWFQGLWRSAALRCGATPSYVTMLRPVTEVVGSKQKYYDTRFGELNRTAAWVNMMLHTERATRGSQRRFVRYHDLLQDWTVPVFGLGQAFDLQAVKLASANSIREVHNFIDPSLRRVQLTWDDVDVPQRLRDVAEESWQTLNKLADPDGDTPDLHAQLDELRAEYAALYEEAEAIAQSSVVAAARAARQQAGSRALAAPAPRGKAPLGERVAARVPHSVRAAIPPRARRGVKRMLSRTGKR